LGENDLAQGVSDDTTKVDFVDRAIIQASAFQPFASVRQISCMVLLSQIDDIQPSHRILWIDI
jgi:hypothetical protein